MIARTRRIPTDILIKKIITKSVIGIVEILISKGNANSRFFRIYCKVPSNGDIMPFGMTLLNRYLEFYITE